MAALACVRSSSGIFRKKSKFTRSRSRCARIGSMLMALCLTASLLLAGQMSTHTPQPVQSSGATWIVIRCPGRSLPLTGFDLNVAGALAAASAG